MFTTPRSRRLIASISIGVTLSLAPLVPSNQPVSAEAPAVSVAGLARGARGDAVVSVQAALVNQGLQVSGGVDGVFGAGTESALKAFQEQHGLSVTGVVDDATALALGLTSSKLLGLTQGVRGPAVTALQQSLVNAGITVAGGVDGIFGQGTSRAVKAFQKDRGYSPTGVVDAATAAALEQIGSAAPKKKKKKATAEPEAGSNGQATASGGTTAEAAATSSLVGLKIGSRDDRVKELQSTLMAAGFTVVGGADGIFGALTANALKSFQNANGIGVTGVVDKATAKALAAVTTTSGSGKNHAPAATNPFVGLQYGSLGADVKALQTALMSAGLSVRGGADGVFGNATRSAVKAYQAKLGLQQTGKVDADTASALSSGSTTSGGSPFAGLKAGALGNTVKSLQQSLIDAGIKVRGGADGIFGPATANAVKEFQLSQGLEATGVVDAATAGALADPKKPAPSENTSGAVGFPVYGEKGTRVLALQSALVKAGISVRGGVDGDFGGGTSAAVMDFQRARGLSVTGKVSAATAVALGLAGMPEPTAPDPASVALAVFPVQGKCYYGDSWGYPRSGGRVHLGVDIIAPEGKLLYAVADGTITKVYADYPGSLAGNGVRLTTADGTYFFYAHMIGVADGIKVGTKVKAGQVVGAVGSTGSSAANHLHFEVHPQGGSAVNPYPIVKAIDGCGNETPLPQP
jgi:peptidoglycan hydrolase-like protein with peptidoglycan-binding domain